MIKRIIIGFACLGSSFTLQSFAADDPYLSRDYQSIKALYQAIDNLNDADRYCDSTDDCAVLGVGHRACGGSSQNKVVSKKNPNFNIMSIIAKKSAVLERKFNQTYNIFSICSLAPMPKASCVNNACVADENSF